VAVRKTDISSSEMTVGFATRPPNPSTQKLQQANSVMNSGYLGKEIAGKQGRSTSTCTPFLHVCRLRCKEEKVSSDWPTEPLCDALLVSGSNMKRRTSSIDASGQTPNDLYPLSSNLLTRLTSLHTTYGTPANPFY